MRHGIKHRDLNVIARRLRGETLQEVADDLHVTRERVRQIQARAARIFLATFGECERLRRQVQTMENTIEELKRENYRLASCACSCAKSPAALTIDEVELSVRAYNCLKNAGIYTLADLCGWSAGKLLTLRNFGRRSLLEVRTLLGRFGRRLKGDGTEVPANEDPKVIHPQEDR